MTWHRLGCHLGSTNIWNACCGGCHIWGRGSWLVGQHLIPVSPLFPKSSVVSTVFTSHHICPLYRVSFWAQTGTVATICLQKQLWRRSETIEASSPGIWISHLLEDSRWLVESCFVFPLALQVSGVRRVEGWFKILKIKSLARLRFAVRMFFLMFLTVSLTLYFLGYFVVPRFLFFVFVFLSQTILWHLMLEKPVCLIQFLADQSNLLGAQTSWWPDWFGMGLGEQQTYAQWRHPHDRTGSQIWKS